MEKNKTEQLKEQVNKIEKNQAKLCRLFRRGVPI